MSFFDKLKKGLIKTKDKIGGGINKVFANFRKVDQELLDELEETLIMSDVNISTTQVIIDKLEETIRLKNIQEADEVKEELENILIEILEVKKESEEDSKKDPLENNLKVLLVIGVNGVGKTTSIGKIANIYKREGKRVLIAAADTFRAAAVEQLEIWAERANTDILKGEEKEDPSSVAFKASKKAIDENYDILIIDTAGRLHNKKNLMDELSKINRSIDKALNGYKYNKETYLVLDGNTGQNAISQAEAFNSITDITGIILTKLDGTAKGGAVFSVVENTKIPIEFIGVGEGIEDLERFNAQWFVSAIIN